MGPSSPSQSGPTVPKSDPSSPRETQPTIPGQPAPGLPQSQPMPGQPGTIPERAQQPRDRDSMVVSTDDIKKAQDALKMKGLNPGTDGQMDAKTQQALRDFQKANDLPATGTLDEKTAAKLGVDKSSTGRSLPDRERSKSGTSSSKSDSTLPKSDSTER
jgi:peptidoglycan hydrolase-like protein with peptidoglycan-binding domain